MKMNLCNTLANNKLGYKHKNIIVKDVPNEINKSAYAVVDNIQYNQYTDSTP